MHIMPKTMGSVLLFQGMVFYSFRGEISPYAEPMLHAGSHGAITPGAGQAVVRKGRLFYPRSLAGCLFDGFRNGFLNGVLHGIPDGRFELIGIDWNFDRAARELTDHDFENRRDRGDVLRDCFRHLLRHTAWRRSVLRGAILILLLAALAGFVPILFEEIGQAGGDFLVVENQTHFAASVELFGTETLASEKHRLAIAHNCASVQPHVKLPGLGFRHAL